MTAKHAWLRPARRIGGAGLLVLTVLGFSAPAHAAQVVHVSTGGSDATGCGAAGQPCKTLAHAVSVAAGGDTVRLGRGTFPVPAPIQVQKSLTITGAGRDATILDGQDSAYSGTKGMLYFASGSAATSSTVEDLGIVRSGRTSGNVYGIVLKGGSSSGPGPHVNLTVRHVTYTANPSAPNLAALWFTQNAGTTVVDDVTTTGVTGNSVLIDRHPGPVTIRNSHLETAAGKSDSAIFDFSYGGATWSITRRHTFSGNTLRGQSAIGISAGLSGQSPSDFSGVTISGNTVRSQPQTARAIALSTVPGAAASATGHDRARAAQAPGGQIADVEIAANALTGSGAGDGIQLNGAVPGASVTGNSVQDYQRGIVLAPSPGSAAQVPTGSVITANQLHADVGLFVNGATGTRAPNNWWGCNAGPAGSTASDCDAISSDQPVSAPTWIVMRVTVTPTVLAAGGQATVSVALDRNNLGEPVKNVDVDTAPATLRASGGTVAPATPAFANLVATATFTSTGIGGRAVTATKDAESVTAAWPDVAGANILQDDLARAGGNQVGPDPLLACARQVAITGVTASGSNVVVEGFARTRYSGQKVFITYRPLGERVIAAPVVHSDGSFRATTRRPKGPRSGTNEARYSASIGGARSKAIKLTRRMPESHVSYRNGRLHVSGRLSKPLLSSERVHVTQGDSCGKYREVATLKVSKSGAFEGSVRFHPTHASTSIRLKALVRGSAGGKLITYSIAKLVLTPSS